MQPILIEPTDTLFFRDSIPMSSGQGKGAGARLPLPSTLHEAIRASLFEQHGRSDERAAFRPSNAPRSGGWLGKAKSQASEGSKDFQSLQLIGPFPVRLEKGQAPEWHLPLPLDLAFDGAGKAHAHQLLLLPDRTHTTALPCIAVSTQPANKHAPTGFLSLAQMQRYLDGQLDALIVTESSQFFLPEYRIGVEISPDSFSAADGQLYAATHARPREGFRLGAMLGLKKPINGEEAKLTALDFLILGGERRLARIRRENIAAPIIPSAPNIEDNGQTVILKWVLATPAVFAHGWLPGWCKDTQGQRPEHDVCLPLNAGRARLIAATLGKLQPFAGWDSLEHRAKPTQLAVPAGSVYHFLCENAAAARELAALLHWRPRSDAYGEKGFGYGLCTTAKWHPSTWTLPDKQPPEPRPTSEDIRQIADQLLPA